jgi:hypothetical protein
MPNMKPLPPDKVVEIRNDAEHLSPDLFWARHHNVQEQDRFVARAIGEALNHMPTRTVNACRQLGIPLNRESVERAIIDGRLTIGSPRWYGKGTHEATMRWVGLN